MSDSNLENTGVDQYPIALPPKEKLIVYINAEKIDFKEINFTVLWMKKGFWTEQEMDRLLMGTIRKIPVGYKVEIDEKIYFTEYVRVQKNPGDRITEIFIKTGIQTSQYLSGFDID